MLLLHIIWIFAAGLLIVYTISFHFRVSPSKRAQSVAFNEPVSVVICAKNEANNLRKNLPEVLQQDHPHYEVILVNDASTDDTLKVAQEFASKHANLKLVNIDSAHEWANSPGKRKALGLGIKASKHKIILLTDADCRPLSQHWVSEMTQGFSEADLVLGYSPYERSTGFLAALAAWDNLETAMQYFGLARAGRPYMGVGRNLAYRKSLYLKSGVEDQAIEIASGDDDLLVGKAAIPTETAWVLNKEARTISNAPADIFNYWQQKRRHLSTAFFYQPSTKFLLAIHGFSKLVFYAGLFLLWLSPWAQALAVLAVMKFAVQGVSLLRMCNHLQTGYYLLLFPVWDFLNTLILAFSHLFNIFAPSNRQWS